jgi:HAD superfamily hydrolase (TIGR01509 family)
MGVEAVLACWFEEDFVVDSKVLAAATAWADRGVPLALVSNQEPRRARYLEERFASLLPISGVAFSGDLGVVKSDAAFYDSAERRLGLHGTGRPVVFLDDTAANVEMASRHGWTGIHFTKGGDWRRRMTDALDDGGGGGSGAGVAGGSGSGC